MPHGVVAAVDIGTSKVACVVVESRGGSPAITGAGQAPIAGGIREGVLLDVREVARAVAAAVSDAEQLCTSDVREVYVSVSGAHVRGFSGIGTVSVGRLEEAEDREITPEDVRRAEEAARAVGLPTGCRVLEVVRRGYSVDGFDRLRKAPVGLRAEQVTASVYTIIADRTAVMNLEAAVEAAGLGVSGVVPSALASAAAVLSPDEMEMGVALADIGAGTTDVAVFHGGTPAHVGVVPMGGGYITSDLQTLRIPWEQAEKIKTEWAVASSHLVDPNGSIRVLKLGGRGVFTLSHPVVSQMVCQRVEEIFEGIASEIAKSGIDLVQLPAGLVVTGGTSRLRGLVETGARVTGLPVEPGLPVTMETSTEMTGTPEFATAVGSTRLALEAEARGSEKGGFLSKLAGWITELVGRVR